MISTMKTTKSCWGIVNNLNNFLAYNCTGSSSAINEKSLRLECRALEKMMRKEEDLAGLYQDERQRVNYFWIVAKKDMEDKQAELRNKEREL